MLSEVWIVDDDPAILSLVTVALERFGADVRKFSTVSAVIDALASGSSPDVCLADWTMADGPILRAVPLMPNTRVVVMSGNPAAETGLPEQVEWLSKPFRLAELSRLVETAEPELRP